MILLKSSLVKQTGEAEHIPTKNIEQEHHPNSDSFFLEGLSEDYLANDL